jgi:hypothetical protein
MTFQTEQPGANIGEFFWIQWVLANAVGFAVGAVLSLSFGLYGASLLPQVGAESESVAGPVSGIFAWILLWVSAIFEAVAIGAAQWFFWRGRVRWAGQWFLATSLGRLVSQFIILGLGWLASQFTIPSLFSSPGTVPFSPVFGTPSSLIFSARFGIVPVVLVAFLQWLILRKHVWGAGWWILASVAGAVVGSVGSLIGAIASGFAALVIPSHQQLYLVLSVGISSATDGAVTNAITGVALRQLLQQPIPNTPPSTVQED